MFYFGIDQHKLSSAITPCRRTGSASRRQRWRQRFRRPPSARTSRDGNRYLKLAFSHAAIRAVEYFPDVRRW